MRVMHKKIICIFLSAFMLGMILLNMVGCNSKTDEPLNTLADFKDKNIVFGMAEDVLLRDELRELCPNCKIEFYTDTGGYQAVMTGRIDAYVCGKEILQQMLASNNNTDLRILDEPFHVFESAIGLSPTDPIENYEQRVNDAIEQLRADGTLQDMYNRWIISGNDTMPEIEKPENPEATLRVATFGEAKPHTYFKDGELTGEAIEIAYRIAAMLNCDIEWYTASYPSMLAGLAAGKYDMISANLYVEKERGDAIRYSDTYEESKICFLVRADQTQPKAEYASVASVQKANRFGVVTATSMDEYTRKYFPGHEIIEYNTLMDEVMALTANKIDALIFDRPTLDNIAANNEGVAVIPDNVFNENYYFLANRDEKGQALISEFNEWLAGKRADGTLEQMKEFWIGKEEPTRDFLPGSLPAPNGTLHVAVNCNMRPDTHYYYNLISGYPTELIYRFCEENGYGYEVSDIAFSAAIPALSSGKADILVGFFSYTEERAENVLFSEPIFQGGVGVMVRTTTQSDATFWGQFKSGFKKTFITENRWQMILSGFGITLLITFLGFVLANLMGIVFCALAMSKKKINRVIADVYSRLMQGTPIVVVLMILYYVIFGKTDLNGVWVAVIGFGIANGAILSQIFEGAIQGVEIGQTEASLALGFTKVQTFFGIVLPQAIRKMLPAYFSALIALMQSTSIVGYIAVIDLTKASDIIRSSTFEPFFPLISVAIIYFSISAIFLGVMKNIQKRLEPKRETAEEETAK